jgi:hypothetical protein
VGINDHMDDWLLPHPGGLLSWRPRADDGVHIDSRPKVEEILEIACPVCAAPPGRFCDRSDWFPRSAAGKALKAAGTPPSHAERMWSHPKQGHGPAEFGELRERGRRNSDSGTAAARAPRPEELAVARVRCPFHGVAAGVQCPGRFVACRARIGKLVKREGGRIARQRRRPGTRQA